MRSTFPVLNVGTGQRYAPRPWPKHSCRLGRVLTMRRLSLACVLLVLVAACSPARPQTATRSRATSVTSAGGGVRCPPLLPDARVATRPLPVAPTGAYLCSSITKTARRGPASAVALTAAEAASLARQFLTRPIDD